jgi:hypothetical protein
VSRQYYALSSFPTADANLTYDAAHGIKCCIDLRPAYNPTSATDLANLATMLAAWKTAGLAAEVSLWAEPFNNGLSSAQYIAMVAYYGPTVRTYYPLVFCTSALSVQNNSENTYYPGDSAVDKIATDLYAIRWLTGTTLDAPASIADSAVPPKPFGLWECGAAPQGSTLLVGDTATFEVTNSTWTGAGNATTPRSTLQAHTGTGSLAITSVASGTMDAAHCAGANIATQGLPCVPGDQIACSAWVRAATSARTVQAGANFYTSGGAFVSSLFDTVHGITDSTSAWNQVTGTVTAPATAAFCRLDIRVLATGGAAEVHYADDCSLGNLNTGQSQADVTSYYGYIQAYFATRAATSKANADLIQFNSGGASGANAPIVTPVLGPADFRVALFQSLYTALDGPLSGAAVPVLGGAGTLSSAASITGVAAAVTAQGGAGTAAGAGATNVTGVAAPVAVAAPAGAVSAGVAVTGSGAPAVVAAPAGTAAGAGKIIGVGAPVTVAAPAGTAASSVNVTGAAPVTAAAPAGTAAAGASITGTAAPVTVAAPAGVAFGSSPNANVTGVAAAVTVAAPAGVPSAAGKVTGTGAPAAVAGGQGTASAPAAVTGSAAHVTAASPAGTTASAASVTGTGAPVLAAAPAGTLAAAAATAGLAALVTALGGTGTPAVGGATVKATSVATVTARGTSAATVTGPGAGATVTGTTHTATVTDPRDGTPAVTTPAAHTATVS